MDTNNMTSNTPLVTTAVLPVAGLGTRFLPASKVVPKELFPVLDKPLIEYAVDEALSAGATDFIFVISPNKTSIIQHFEDNINLVHALNKKQQHDIIAKIKCKIPGAIHTVIQQRTLGLGHAIHCAKELVGNKPFHVILPDDVVLSDTPCQKQLADVFAHTRSGVVAVEYVAWENVHKYGVLDCTDTQDTVVSVKGFVEKPARDVAPSNLSIIGRYIFTPEIFTYLEQSKIGTGGEIHITDAMADILSKQAFHGVKFTGNRFDCGSKSGFLEAQIAAASRDTELQNMLPDILKKYIRQG